MKRLLVLALPLCSSMLFAQLEFPECSGNKTFTQHIEGYGGDYEKTVLVGDIPAGIQGLKIKLESDKDVDIRLYGEDNDKIVHWPDGILSGSAEATKPYHNIDITYSGFYGVAGERGHEFIHVAGSTPTSMTMKAFGYVEGDATVNYSWTGKDGCIDGEGEFTQDIPKNDVATVGTIKKGLKNIMISLESSKDIDIQLFGEDGTDIVKWKTGILSGPGKQTTEYNGLKIEWTGYDGADGAQGHEFINIEGKTNENLEMKVFGYKAGVAKVHYVWDRERAQLPDYKTEISVNESSFTKPVATPIEFLIKISELANGINTGPLRITMTKNLNMNLTFDKTLTSANGLKIANNEWEVIKETATHYILEYKGLKGERTAKFPPKASMNIMFKGTITPPAYVKGKFMIGSRIRFGAGDNVYPNNRSSVQIIHQDMTH